MISLVIIGNITNLKYRCRQLSWVLILISDISNLQLLSCSLYCWYQQFEKLISLFRINDWWPRWVWVGECFFLYRLTRVVLDKIHRAVKRLCVCACVRVCVIVCDCLNYIASVVSHPQNDFMWIVKMNARKLFPVRIQYGRQPLCTVTQGQRTKNPQHSVVWVTRSLLKFGHVFCIIWVGEGNVLIYNT